MNEKKKTRTGVGRGVGVGGRIGVGGLVGAAAAGEGAGAAPLARLALAEAVAVAEKVLAVEARDLLAGLDVAQQPHARRVPARRHKLQPQATLVSMANQG